MVSLTMSKLVNKQCYSQQNKDCANTPVSEFLHDQPEGCSTVGTLPGDGNPSAQALTFICRVPGRVTRGLDLIAAVGLSDV